jgi:predicted short-subunit dehydrogenase-like oxidoreductase (DUF2520 family)
MPAPEITIIGVGGLGYSLAKALSEANFTVKSVFNRTAGKAKEIADELDINQSGTFPLDDSELGDLIFITVSDSAIANVAQQLADISEDFSHKTIVHCSGNETASLLQALKEKGGHIASFHPLQTFTKRSKPSDFNDIYFSLQGDKAAFSHLGNLAEKLGARTFEVSREQKSHLHAAAVFASNYLNTLLEVAVDTASASGVSREIAKKALFPLIKTSLKNIESQSFNDALTGPIKRGDWETVKHHLHLLEDWPELLTIYKTLGRRTVKMARKSGDIDQNAAQKVLKLME